MCVAGNNRDIMRLVDLHACGAVSSAVSARAEVQPDRPSVAKRLDCRIEPCEDDRR